MDLEQTVTITTPEGVRLELTVAGMGSRIAATTIDFILQSIVMIVAVISVISLASSESGVLFFGLLALLGFLVFFGYPILTEVLWEGKSVGKAAIGLRVVRTDGGAIGFVPSLIRNVIRLIDFLPSFYGVGFVVAMINARGQRLGDLAADTMVVKLPKTRGSKRNNAQMFGLNLPPPAQVPWDVSAVTQEEMATLRHFAERRESIGHGDRARLADTLYGKMKDKVVPTSQAGSKEHFLLQIIAEKERDR